MPIGKRSQLGCCIGGWTLDIGRIDFSDIGTVFMQPNYLFVVGAPKCGTTTIAHVLGRHRDVCLAASKEPRFFTDYGSRTWHGPMGQAFAESMVTDRIAYEAEFAANPQAAWRIDASTDYLSCPASAEMIRDFADSIAPAHVQVVIAVRDPVKRILSEYRHTTRDGHERLTLMQSMAAEPDRIAAGWHPLFHHMARTQYSTQIARYRSVLGDRVTIVDYHSLDAELDRIWGLMNLTPVPIEATPRMNTSHKPKLRWVRKILRNQTTLATARAIVPKSMRRGIRQGIETANTDRLVATDADVIALRQMLGPEIQRCLDDPLIPTSAWSLGET
ncbi:sulfotransferase [Aestuariibius sp. HNIBRBA575]|uniref:sulfotransferase n=1 Tax=Aestuariibius sp. HNIBRBA575 TaxID=3233343 RepID=UPI0034A57D78